MIEVKNLIYDYPGTRALNNASFTIQKGRITALVGPNGSGKTTLLKCLSTLLTPDSGEIMLDDYDVISHPEKIKSDIGFLQDFFGLYDNLTIEQALTYFGMAYKLPLKAIPEKVDYLCNKLGLPDKKAKIRHLSRGMRQRTAIAQAIIHQPRYLFLDEPASGLDPESRYELGKQFIELNNLGMTLIVSSHILAELDQYATDMLVIRNGMIIEHATINAKKATEGFLFITFNIAEYIPDIESKIRMYENVADVIKENHKVTVKLKDGTTVLQDFLKHLINSDIPVTEYQTEKKNIQEQYLSTINRK